MPVIWGVHEKRAACVFQHWAHWLASNPSSSSRPVPAGKSRAELLSQYTPVCSYSRARHFRRPLGIMTMLVTCVNPAIGSGSVLPGIARLCVWADGWRAMPNLLDSSLKDSSFPRARRLRLAITPLLFIALLLEWHIFNHYDQSAGAQV